MRSLTMIVILLLCVGCGATPTTPPDAQRTDSPPATSTVIYEQPGDDSLRAIALDGTPALLVDPRPVPQSLLWSASPDGHTLAVIIIKGPEIKTGGYDRAVLWTVDVDASNPRKLLDLGSAATANNRMTIDAQNMAIANEYFQRLNWTPDGQTIIVTSAHEGQSDLYAVPVDGSQARRLTDTAEAEFQASLSPDGKHLVYASAQSFGTGAGWARPEVWYQPLDGEPGLLLAHPFYTSVQVVGWINPTTSIATTGGQSSSESGTKLWVTEIGVQPRLLNQAMAGPAWDLAPDRLIFTALGRDRKNPSSDLAMWQGDASAPTLLAQGLRTIDKLKLGPQPELIFLCTDTALSADEAERALWHAGTLSKLDSGPCDNTAWSPGGRLALGGSSSMIVGPDGGVLELDVPEEAKMAGWLGEVVYFFAPVAAGWQLYQLDTTRQDGPQPVGEPIAEEPVKPTLVLAKSP